uniref:BHLH domain-containing protein n=1 Tax=Angiostrongylus cantonensis TaxID=6313 RepID=A0A0K0D1U3_ANGCA
MVSAPSQGDADADSALCAICLGEVTVAELHAAAAVAQLVARGRSLPPLNEKQCIRLRIRRLKRRLDTIQENMSSRNPQDDQYSELGSRTMRLIEEITSLETVKRESTTRFDIVSNATFRSLIYEDNLECSYIDGNPKCVRYSPEVFNANPDEEIERLLIFVDRELEIVWRNVCLAKSCL